VSAGYSVLLLKFLKITEKFYIKYCTQSNTLYIHQLLKTSPNFSMMTLHHIWTFVHSHHLHLTIISLNLIAINYWSNIIRFLFCFFSYVFKWKQDYKRENGKISNSQNETSPSARWPLARTITLKLIACEE